MAKAAKEKSKTKSRKRKILKFFLRLWLYFIITLVIIFILLFFAFRVLIPSEYVKKMASRTMEQKFSRKLIIEKVQINPFTGFEFSNVVLERLEGAANQFPVNYASIEKIKLKYSLRGLLKKHFLIKEVILDSPYIDLTITTVTDTSQQEKKEQPDSLLTPALPFSMELDVLRLKDAQIKITTQDTSVTQSIYLADLDCYLDGINLPKGNILENDSLLTGKLKMTSENADFSFDQSSEEKGTLSLSGKVNFVSSLNIVTLDSVTMEFKLLLDKLFLRASSIPNFTSAQMPYPLSVESTVDLNLNKETIQIKRLNLSVDNDTWLGFQGNIKGFMTSPQPSVSASINSSNIPVTQLLSIAKMFVPDSLMPKIYFHNKKAAISLTGTRVSGVVPDSLSGKGLNFYSKLQLHDLGMTLNHGQMELLNLNLKAETSGKLVFQGLERLKVYTLISLDSTYYALSDTFSVYSGKGQVTLDADLNKYMLPRESEIKFSLSNLIGADLNGHFSLFGENSKKSLKGEGEIILSEIDLKQFPQAPLETNAMLQCNVDLNTLDSISAVIKFVSDSLIVPLQYEVETLPSIYFLTNVELSSDTTFQNIEIKSLTTQLNDLFSAQATGWIRNGGSEGVTLFLQDSKVNHYALFDWLPNRVRERYSDLNITGSTHLQGDFYGKVSPDQFYYDVKAHLFTDKTNIIYPAQFINITGFNLNVLASAQSNGKSNVDVSLKIDSTFTDNLSKSVFLNNSIACKIYSPDFTSFQIDSGRINLPDMNAQGSFGAYIKQINQNPHIYVNLQFEQIAQETIKITRDISLRGTTNLTAQVEMDTTLLDFAGTLKTKELTVYLPAETRVQNINADFSFQQKIDLKHKIFLESEKSSILTPTEGSIDYLVYRPYYRKTLPEISYLSIDKIQAAGYVIDNFTMEALLGKSRVDIPSFFGKLYGGNFGGRISVNLAGGDINQATYNLSAHFSGINSDLLLPDIKREKTLGVINGNAQFTGTGLNPASGIDIKGDFYITEIGPKVADNLLHSLDPEGTDSGIRTTRRLINLGFEPQLFTFSFKYGFFYTIINFSQPWYFPAKLSGSKIELNRKPVNFFIQMALAKPAG